jgi:hypothetical protein
MVKMKNTLTIILLVCINSFIYGQNTFENVKDNKTNWEFDVTPYMWFSSLKGDVSFLNQSVPVNTEFKDIWDQLSFGFLLHAEAQKGSWTIMTDFIYLNLKEDGTIKNTSQTTSTETKQTIFELGGAYSLLKFQDYFVLEGLAGMRYFGLAPEFDINQLTVFDKSLDFVDPYIGIRFKSVSEKWINSASFDFGGFGIGSEISWKLNLNVGYQFNDLISLNVGYQGYDVDYEGEESFKYNVFTGGFLTGLNFSF